MFELEQEIRTKFVQTIAQNMAVAARTAPKARGLDSLQIGIVSGEELNKLAEKMNEIGEAKEMPFFLRDALNIENSEAVLLVGTSFSPIGLNCGYCGHPTCKESTEKGKNLCFFNAHDMGVALGSAVSVAANARIDNRIMFSVGFAAKELGYFPNSNAILGVPLSVNSKNQFFDRK